MCPPEKEQESKRARLERERELRLFIGATLCGRPKTPIGKWQLIIKISSTLQGEDKGEGDNYIADCWLLIADWKNHLKCEK